MSYLGGATISARAINRASAYEAISYTMAANNIEWNLMTLTLPVDIKRAHVVGIEANTVNAATAHSTDEAVVGERGRCNVFRTGADYAHFIELSRPIGGFNSLYDANVVKGWITYFDFVWGLYVDQNMYFNITLPPADDNATPTGDYELRICLREVTYNKK